MLRRRIHATRPEQGDDARAESGSLGPAGWPGGRASPGAVDTSRDGPWRQTRTAAGNGRAVRGQRAGCRVHDVAAKLLAETKEPQEMRTH